MLLLFKQKEIITKLLKNSFKCDESNDKLMSYLFSRQAYLLDSNDNIVLDNLITSLYNLRDYAQALFYLEKWFSLIKDAKSDIRGKMYFIKGRSLLEMGKYDQALEALRKSMQAYVQAKNNAKVGEIDRIMRDELPRRSQRGQVLNTRCYNYMIRPNLNQKKEKNV